MWRIAGLAEKLLLLSRRTLLHGVSQLIYCHVLFLEHIQVSNVQCLHKQSCTQTGWLYTVYTGLYSALRSAIKG
jgi:hypothetical protein